MGPYWIQTGDVKLAIVPRPRGWDWLEDDIRDLRKAGVDVIVSALEAGEAEELGLAEEESLCRGAGIKFVSFPIEDSVGQFRDFIGGLNQRLDEGKAVGIHCRACIGRSSVVAAAVLIARGQSAEDAFRAIEEARGCAVPDTDEQKRWIEQLSARS